MVRVTLEHRIAAAAVTVAAMSLAVHVVLASAAGAGRWATLVAAAAGLLVAGGAAVVAAHRTARPLLARIAFIERLVERFEPAGAPPSLPSEDDELSGIVRAHNEAMRTAGRQVDEAARDRTQMEAVLSSMSEGVIAVDPEGRLQLVNEAARRMLGLEGAAIHHHYVETIRHPAISGLVSQTLAGDTPEPVRLSPPRDPSRSVIVRAAPTEAGRPHGAVLVLHDITDLQQVDRMRREFVANVSHELRTPLTAIRGYLEALSEGDTGPADRDGFLDVIHRHTLRMERLVRDLLQLARLDAGEEPLQRSVCDTRTVVHGVISDLGAVLEARRQRVDVAIADGAEQVSGDPAKLHDILHNLLVNASTYAPEASVIVIAAHRAGVRMALSVSDQGPGIPDEDLPRIFERFYRVDRSRGRDRGGTGLGLAIVKHLVELHGGSVRAENEPHGGARVTVELPVAGGEGTGVRPYSAPTSRMRR